MNVNTNYYEVLGISQNATPDDIRTAYRTMAKRYHPDLNKDANAEDKFKLINEANDVLSNPDTKLQYDTARMMGAQRPHGFTYQRPRSDPRQYSDFDLVRNKDINITYNVTMEEAFKGKEAVINYRPNRASGDPNTVEIVNVTIPRYCENGHKLFVYGRGDDANKTIKPGNLIITVKMFPHPLYERGDGPNLKAKLKVNVFDLILGTEFLVTMVDGGDIKLKIKKGTQPGSILKVPGRGWVDRYGNRGDVLFTIEVDIPVLTEKQEKELEKFADSIK